MDDGVFLIGKSEYKRLKFNFFAVFLKDLEKNLKENILVINFAIFG
jgi:hypothetical protein